MALNVYNQTDYRGYLKYKTYFRDILNNAAKVLDMPKRVAVSVIFVNDEQIQGINRDYRNIDRPTDVISFALADNKEETDYIPNELGDIFIKREICFLFTHGLLHLNGFDHQTPEEEKEMIKYQKMILDELVGQND